MDINDSTFNFRPLGNVSDEHTADSISDEHKAAAVSSYQMTTACATLASNSNFLLPIHGMIHRKPIERTPLPIRIVSPRSKLVSCARHDFPKELWSTHSLTHSLTHSPVLGRTFHLEQIGLQWIQSVTPSSLSMLPSIAFCTNLE